MARMRYTVVVRHPETMTPVALVEGTEVPEWASVRLPEDDVTGAMPAVVETESVTEDEAEGVIEAPAGAESEEGGDSSEAPAEPAPKTTRSRKTSK